MTKKRYWKTKSCKNRIERKYPWVTVLLVVILIISPINFLAFAVNPNSGILQGAMVRVVITNPTDESTWPVPPGTITVEGEVIITNFTVPGYEDESPSIDSLILTITPSEGSLTSMDIIGGEYFDTGTNSFSVPSSIYCGANIVAVTVIALGIEPEYSYGYNPELSPEYTTEVTSDIEVFGNCELETEEPVFVIEKDYRFANVSFNEGKLGTLLPIDPASGKFIIEVLTNEDNVVLDIIPSEYYSVVTITANQDIPALGIHDDFSDCADRDEAPNLSILDPDNIPGGVAVVFVDNEGNVFDITDELLSMDRVYFRDNTDNGVNDTAIAVLLNNIPAGSKVLLYVKFRFGLSDMIMTQFGHNDIILPSETQNMCTNKAWARIMNYGRLNVTADLMVIEKFETEPEPTPEPLSPQIFGLLSSLPVLPDGWVVIMEQETENGCWRPEGCIKYTCLLHLETGVRFCTLLTINNPRYLTWNATTNNIEVTQSYLNAIGTVVLADVSILNNNNELGTLVSWSWDIVNSTGRIVAESPSSGYIWLNPDQEFKTRIALEEDLPDGSYTIRLKGTVLGQIGGPASVNSMAIDSFEVGG